MIKFNAGIITVGMTAVFLAAALGGCGNSENNKTGQTSADSGSVSESIVEPEDDETENTVMYVPYGDEESYIMVDQNTGAVFTVTPPEDIYDSEGKKISWDDLKKGNILKITGNGIMLESYPGQYPGVSRIDIEKTGSPSDADKYQEIIDQIWQEPDPSQIPSLNIEYTTDLASVSAAASVGGYEWEYPLEDGTMKSVVSDAPFITEWKELNDIRTDQPMDLLLRFSADPVKVTVLRWPQETKEKTEISDGETVSVQETEEGENYMIAQAEPGYLYLVTAEWENGYTDYGFQVLSQENGSGQ